MIDRPAVAVRHCGVGIGDGELPYIHTRTAERPAIPMGANQSGPGWRPRPLQFNPASCCVRPGSWSIHRKDTRENLCRAPGGSGSGSGGGGGRRDQEGIPCPWTLWPESRLDKSLVLASFFSRCIASFACNAPYAYAPVCAMLRHQVQVA